MNYPDTIKDLIECFSKLPSIGTKTAERLAFSVLSLEKEQVDDLSENIKNIKDKSFIFLNAHTRTKSKKLNSFYAGLEIVDKDEQGLVFKCNKFDKERHICTIHKYRSSICRKYPSEEIFKFKGVMSEKCGYYFKPIESFAEVLKKLS